MKALFRQYDRARCSIKHYYGCIKAVLRLYCGCIKAVLRQEDRAGCPDEGHDDVHAVVDLAPVPAT